MVYQKMTVYPSLPHEDGFHRNACAPSLYPSAPPIELLFNPEGAPHKPSCSFYETAGPQPSCNPDYVPSGQQIPESPPPIPHRMTPANRIPPITELDIRPPRVRSPDYGVMPVSNQEINQMDEIHLSDDNRPVSSDVKREVFIKSNHKKSANRTTALVEHAKKRQLWMLKHRRCFIITSSIITFFMTCAIIGAVLMFLYSQGVIFQ